MKGVLIMQMLMPGAVPSGIGASTDRWPSSSGPYLVHFLRVIEVYETTCERGAKLLELVNIYIQSTPRVDVVVAADEELKNHCCLSL